MGGKICCIDDCSTYGIFNYPGSYNNYYCSKHKLNGMIDVVNKKCKMDNCNKQPRFCIPGNKDKYCSTHATSEMIDCYALQCTEVKCTTKPIYGYIRNKPIKCTLHKLANMIDLVHKKCKIDSCTKRPVYGYNKGIGIYCSEHKIEGTRDVCNVICKYDNCNKLNPLYNFKNSNDRGIYCKSHKLPGMIDVMHKSCIIDGCETRAGYNFKDMEPIYCAKHITSKDMVSVTSKKCIVKNCSTTCTFGIPGTERTHCFLHKLPNMVSLVGKRCEYPDCHLTPTYDFIGNKGRWCVKHKDPNAVDVRHTMCQICYSIRANTSVYKGYCMRCYMYINPDNPIIKNYKTKEKYVAEFIRDKFTELNIMFDKRIENGVSMRRPDVYIDLSSHVIIIEIDENQHSDYDCICENKRTMELFIDAGSRHLTIIRFNPDSYFDMNGQHISSCWAFNEKGFCNIIDETNWVNRLTVLENTINSIIKEGNTREVNIINLFYDGWID